MPVFEFPIDVKREVTVAVAQHLGLDKPSPPPEKGEEGDWRKIFRMSLRLRNQNGHEDEIAEWEERDIYGKGISIDTIVHGIELASCRDAAYQFGGDCVYILAFHGKDRPNRSRFMFKLYGGQEVSNLAISSGGRGQQSSGEGMLERIMPDLLKYVAGKEEILERRSAHVFETLVKSNQQLTTVVSDYTDREFKLRQIELNMDDHAYERDKKRREDETTETMKREGLEFLKENAPAAIPYVLKALQRLSNGPGPGPSAPSGVGTSADFGADAGWYGPQAGPGPQVAPQAPKAPARRPMPRTKTTAKPVEPANGTPVSGELAKGKTPADAEVVPEAGGSSASGEASRLDQLRLRVALDASRFVMLVRGRKQEEPIRAVLSDEQRGLYDSIVAASEAADFDSEIGIERVASFALMFGGAMKEDPIVVFKLLGALDNMTKLALVELSKLLEAYYEELQSASGQK